MTIDWINVNDRLPDNNELVLVAALCNPPTGGPLMIKEELWVFVGRFWKCSGWVVYFNPRNQTYVQFWSPMPKFPDIEKKEGI